MRRKRLSKNDKYLIAITEESPKDKELILKNMLYCIKILEYIDQDLFKDIEFVKKVLFENGMSLEFMPPEIQNDKELVIIALNNSAGFALKFASEELRADREVVKEAVKQWKAPIKYASKVLQEEFNHKLEEYHQKHKRWE